MRLERKESGDFSQIDTTCRIIEGCGVDKVRLVRGDRDPVYEGGIPGLKRYVNVALNSYLPTGYSMNIRGVDERGFQIIPAFRGVDSKFYILEDLVLSEEGLLIKTTIEERNLGRAKKNEMLPRDLLALMPEV